MSLKKYGSLAFYEIVDFIKIVEYFNYLKRLKVDGELKKWLDNIVIPEEIISIMLIFTKKYELNSGVYEKYDAILYAIKKNKESIKTTLLRSLNSQKLAPYLVDKQLHLFNDQEALLVRGGFNHVIKASVIHRSSGGFFYIVPHSISTLKDERADLISKKEEILFDITREISSKLSNHIMFLEFIDKAYDRFDHYQARVYLAREHNGEFILPKRDSKIILKDFIHPAIANPTPINMDFSKPILLLTGVNAGGKTMMLKSLLSAVFMTKYLLPMKLDKERSHIGSFKNIYAILDDPQSVKNDISTFAGRMLEFSKLFGKKNIVVGVDEIELGTDSDEAASLFKVILTHLKKDAKIVITTHHKRLAALLAHQSDVTLGAALYDLEQQKPKYEFLLGTIGQSYAFETALRYSIPPYIVKEARDVYGEDKERLNELISRSSQLELELKLKSQKLQDELNEIEKLKASLQEHQELNHKELKSKHFNLHMSYEGAKNEVKKALKSSKPDAHRHLNIAHEKIKDINIINSQKPQLLNEGDRVKYGGASAKIISINKKRAYIELDNGMRLRCKLNELKLNKIPRAKIKSSITSHKPTNASMKLDLHGKRVEEALDILDGFISDSLLANFEELLIYHGIGTGKLGRAVKDYLLAHPKIRSFEDAPANMGGFGAKIVKL